MTKSNPLNPTTLIFKLLLARTVAVCSQTIVPIPTATPMPTPVEAAIFNLMPVGILLN